MAKERKISEQSRTSKMAKRKVASKRRMVLESLEDRRLMTVNPDANGWFYPPIGQKTADLGSNLVSQEQYRQRSIAQYGNVPVTFSGGSGEGSAPFSTTEVEPNNVLNQAQFLPLGTAAGKSMVVNVAGQITNNNNTLSFDEDYYAFDLRAGDIFDVTIQSTALSNFWDVTLFDASGRALVSSTTNTNVSRPGISPTLNTTAPLSFSTVVGDTGRYFLRVGDGLNIYNMRLRAFRNSLEAEPVGTKQILYIDFDGAVFNGLAFGIPRTIRLPSMIDTLQPYGFRASDENLLIDKLMATITENYIGTLPVTGGNGYYSADGRPGSFDIEIRNSRDHADPWGLPNVSRVIVGGGLFDFPIPARGVAQGGDLGNYLRQKTAVVLPEVFVLFDNIQGVNRTPTSTLIDVFGTAMGNTISHEAGHLFGLTHHSNTSPVLSIMDQGGLAIGPSRAGTGLDGIFGTSDDVDIDFVRDRNDVFEGLIGVGLTGFEDHAKTLAHTLVTGTIGGATVAGNVFNDKNRNAARDLGDEGLANWEVFLDLNKNGVRDGSEYRALTNSLGDYTMRVPAGTYDVRVVRPGDWIASTASEVVKSVTVASGGSATVNFGAFLPNLTVTGFKWNDINGNGIRDNDEPGIGGVYIYIDLDGDDRPDLGEPASVSRDDGSFTVTPPSAGTFAIREVVEPGFTQTFPGPSASFEHIVTFNGTTPLRGFDFGNNESSDWGDAPAPYLTTRAQGGASHGTTPGLRLGTNFDADGDGRPSANADGDDLNGLLGVNGAVVDDEDGVTVLTPIVRGDNSNLISVFVTNTTGSPAYIQGWIDFNGNGTWESSEQIATNVAAVSGANRITFTTPTGAVSQTFARFRLSQDQGLGPAGRSRTGEVEDYAISIVNGPRTLLQPDTIQVPRNSIANAIRVLDNDFEIPGDPWRITGVSSGSSGGRVTIAADGRSLLYSPALGFVGREEFTYSVTSLSGERTAQTNVVANVVLQFNDPVAIDDSFEVPTNSVSFPLSVLANDIEGRGGALVVTSVTQPNRGGTVSVGSGGQSIRYTPARNFGGTETFSYTVTDATGKTSTAKITVQTVEGARTDDEVAFSFRFLNAANEPITEIRQGERFKVVVLVDDLRPEKAAAETPPRFINSPGVYSAYLDVLYSAGLVTPVPSTGGNLDFAASFQDPYLVGITGSATTPGLLDELGAFVGSIPSFNRPNAIPVTILEFTASSAGIAEFVGDPADNLPNSEVTFYNSPTTRVPTEQIRYGRSSLEIVPAGVNFPFAVDDTFFATAVPLGGVNIDVLTNDIRGTQPPIRIASITQPRSGQTTINGSFVTYLPNTNFTGTDQFTYTITDERGFRSTATVTVHVGDTTGDDIIRLRLATTDLSGVPITSIAPGQKFQLRGYVEDLRTDAIRFGVFAGFQDVLYNSDLVRVDTSAGPQGFAVAFDPMYTNAPSGDIRIPGIINEIGSVQTDTANPTGRGEKLQWTVTLTAGSATGTAVFRGDPADIKPFHDSLVFDPTTPLLPNQIRYVSTALQIRNGTGGTGGSGAGEGFTNRNNAYDVNNDGFVSPIDVLILVNTMNTGGGGELASSGSAGASGEGGPIYYVDVNEDSYLSPLDALMVINFINNRPANGAGGEGEGAPAVQGSTDSQGYELVEVPFLKKRSSPVDMPIYGPLISGEDSDDELSLEQVLAAYDPSSEEYDYLDGLASDIASKI